MLCNKTRIQEITYSSRNYAHFFQIPVNILAYQTYENVCPMLEYIFDSVLSVYAHTIQWLNSHKFPKKNYGYFPGTLHVILKLNS